MDSTRPQASSQTFPSWPPSGGIGNWRAAEFLTALRIWPLTCWLTTATSPFGVVERKSPSHVTRIQRPGTRAEVRSSGESDYRLVAASASCAGALEIWMSPRNGLLNSMIRKIAPDTATAAANRETRAVDFGGANKPKLRKINVVH